MGLELVLELVAETAKTKNRENLTFFIFGFLENESPKVGKSKTFAYFGKILYAIIAYLGAIENTGLP